MPLLPASIAGVLVAGAAALGPTVPPPDPVRWTEREITFVPSGGGDPVTCTVLGASTRDDTPTGLGLWASTLIQGAGCVDHAFGVQVILSFEEDGVRRTASAADNFDEDASVSVSTAPDTSALRARHVVGFICEGDGLCTVDFETRPK
jgi:hypothetical protein